MSDIPSDPASADLPALLAEAERLAAAGRHDDAEALYRSAVASGSCRAREEYAAFLFRAQRYGEAETHFRALLETAHRTNNLALRAVAAHNLAALFRAAGNPQAAFDFQQCALAAELQNRPATTSDLSPSTLSSLANDALLAGKYSLARKLFRRALALETAANSTAGQAADWGSLGLVAIFQGRHRPALACLVRAYVRHRKLKDDFGMGCDLLNIAEAARGLGRLNSAIRFLARAEQKFVAAGAPRAAEIARRLQQQAARMAQVPLRNPLWN